MIISSCCTALPTPAHAEDRVVIYYYEEQGWIPIKYCTLVKAVALRRQASVSDQEMFIFPIEATPTRLPSLLKPITNQRLHRG